MNREQFDYTPKCKMTITMRRKTDNTPVNESEKRQIAKEVLAYNPHYKLSFKSAEDFLAEAEQCNPIPKLPYMTAYECERVYIKQFEDYNKGKWTYDQNEIYCPYWQMSKEEYYALSNALYEQEIKTFKK